MDINALLKKMTLTEKLVQITQFNANCIHFDNKGEITGPAQGLGLSQEELCDIRYFVGSTLNFVGAKDVLQMQKEHMENDPNKIPMLFMMDVVHGYKTIYPIPLALGASFDADITEKCCEMASEEMSAGGVHVTFAPMIDLVRDPRWGRCMETASEDTYLNGEMAKAMVRGFQKSGKVAACVKHFAAYGQSEAGLDYNTTDMSERMLRNYYLPAYKAAIDEGVEMLMTSFNALNGVPSSGNKWLMNDLLRKEWNFDKVVISDYNAIREMKELGYCETDYDCAEKAINATTDVEMMSACYIKNASKLIEEGKISEEQIDKAVLRILRLKEKLGLFENPYLYASIEDEQSVCLTDKNREIARISAEKSAVLLKNENVLPFNKEKVKKVAVIGPFADKVMLGNWCCYGKEEDGVSVLQGVKKLLKNAQVVFSQGCGDGLNENDCSNVSDAVNVAKDCDAVILCLGEDSKMSGESMSRAELRLSNAQKTLIREIVKANKNTAVVLFNGRPLVLSDIIDDIPALMTAWQPGTEGGNAIANLLFGEINFGGKLPMTFPRSEGQIPIYYNSYRSSRPWESPYGSWYQDMPKAPLFPFGYGLSYTDFTYTNLQIDKDVMVENEKVKVSIDVSNVGKVDGETVAQLYIRDDYASLIRPIKELKGYKKIFLKAGEKQTVTFEIDQEMLKYWNNNNFEAEKGSFTVWLSDSSVSQETVKFNLK